MHIKYVASAIIALCCLMLSACGMPDRSVAAGPAEPTVTSPPVDLAVSPTQNIADLLHNRPSSTQSVEIVVYDWQGGGRVAPHGLDDQRCPDLSSASFLTDTPVAGTINFTSGGYDNWLPRYPPDEVAWLLPEFEGTVRLIKSLPPLDAYPPPMTSPVPTQVRGVTFQPEPTADHTPGPTNIGYHVRLRGRLNEPIFQHCAHADRIFVIEAIEPLNDVQQPYSSVFAPPLPGDYAQWQRYRDPDLGFSFSYPPDWQIKGAQEPGKLGSLILHAPKWPQHMIRLRITPAVTLPEQAAPAFYGIDFEQAQARQFMGLATQGANFAGRVIVRETGPYRWFVTETFTANGRDYEFSMDLPMGIYANSELTNAFAIIGATFQDAVADAPAVVAR